MHLLCVPFNVYTATSHRFHIFRRAPLFALTQWICSHTGLCWLVETQHTWRGHSLCVLVLVASSDVLMYLCAYTRFELFTCNYNTIFDDTNTSNVHCEHMDECKCIGVALRMRRPIRNARNGLCYVSVLNSTVYYLTKKTPKMVFFSLSFEFVDMHFWYGLSLNFYVSNVKIHSFTISLKFAMNFFCRFQRNERNYLQFHENITIQNHNCTITSGCFTFLHWFNTIHKCDIWIS